MIMENSLSSSTMKQYNSTLKMWWKFCNDRKFSPFTGNISQVISFLQNILTSTTNIYTSFNTHRAALSLITSTNLGESLLLKRFLKGIFKLRPPRPKYNCTWDPQQVLNYLENLESNDSLKALSSKLITLLALATGQRIHTLSLISCDNISIVPTGIKIRIPALVKTSRAGSFQPYLDLPYFLHRPKLCVASTLQEYMEKTKSFRSSLDEKLFFTSKPPYRPASKQTLSRWVKETMINAGIDSDLFSPHSTRHASTSAALRKGLSLDKIRKTAGWTDKSSIFARFYNRPLLNNEQFLDTVFQ